MRLPDTSTSLTNDQYNGNHAHSIIKEERPLNVNSAKHNLSNQNSNDDCYMKECYCGKLCKGLRGLKAHQRSCKVLDLPELREMLQQPLLQELIVNESDNISDVNNSDNAQSVNSVELTSSILENMSGVANKEFSLSIILQ